MKIKEKVFTEIGFGNPSFLSTEIEKNNSEKRIKGFKLPKKINDVYFRVWIFKSVLIVSIKDGFKIMKKPKNKIKILFGIGGFN